ncbi:GTP-binding protein 8 [Neosynchiropus ocellatus]
MFGLGGARQCRRGAHRLASLHDVMALPPKKRQGALFPISVLEGYLDSSVDTTDFHLFQPSAADILKAETLFCSTPTHKIDYHTSAERMDHAPSLAQPEVCFIGRSNVGKSSLIKALFSLSPEVEVRVSKTPGHTKKMNFFRVGRSFCMVDMPGYGHRAPRDFVDMVEPYLLSRKSLVRTFMLVDGSLDFQKNDLIALEMCEEMRRPYVIVLTKVDKCGGRGKLLRNLMALQDVIQSQTRCCFPQPFLASSLSYSGVHLLRCFIAHVTGSINLRDTSQS